MVGRNKRILNVDRESFWNTTDTVGQYSNGS